MKNKKVIREGQIRVNNQGIEMKIIRYRNANDIDIEFLNDNYVVKNKKYEYFINGNIKHPNYKNGLFINRVGERRQNRDGDWMEIIECFGSNNNTVKFDDDNSIKMNVSWQWFDKGIVSHPIRYSDSLLYLYYDIAKIISIPENEITLNDCSNIYPSSKNKYYVKCPYCNKISSNKKFLYALTNQGFSCEYCSDGISFPNKILRQISKQLDLNWEFEYSEKWMEKYKFDAYDKTLKQPIEMDAEFFINNKSKIVDNHKGKRKEIDNWKDNEAIKHNMNKPRRINLMDSEKYSKDKFNYIKQQIYSTIGDLYDLDKINWNEVFVESQKSLMIEACKLWENGIYSTIEISKILNISHSTSLNYLKKGNILGLCNYTKDKAMKESAKKRTNIRHPNAILYIVIKSNGNKYIDEPLCGKDIYDKGFLKIHHDIFNKYIKPYNKIDINNLKNMGISNKIINKLLPYDGWQFILL